MKLVKIDAYEDGSHDNLFPDYETVIPDGWAKIPDDMKIPDIFPFVNIVAENGIVKEMTPNQQAYDDMKNTNFINSVIKDPIVMMINAFIN